MAGRKKTFRSFLKDYCKYLTNSHDFRMRSFLANLNDNHRAHEPVLLYSLYTNRSDNFSVNFDYELKTKYSLLVSEFEKCGSVEAMFGEECSLSYDFQKVYMAYTGELLMKSPEQPLKVNYCDKLKELLNKKDCSQYKVCKELNLNFGNFHTFLKGDYKCLSLDNCRRVYQYLNSL